jgi:hypothetical protein
MNHNTFMFSDGGQCQPYNNSQGFLCAPARYISFVHSWLGAVMLAEAGFETI